MNPLLSPYSSPRKAQPTWSPGWKPNGIEDRRIDVRERDERIRRATERSREWVQDERIGGRWCTVCGGGGQWQVETEEGEEWKDHNGPPTPPSVVEKRRARLAREEKERKEKQEMDENVQAAWDGYRRVTYSVYCRPPVRIPHEPMGESKPIDTSRPVWSNPFDAVLSPRKRKTPRATSPVKARKLEPGQVVSTGGGYLFGSSAEDRLGLNRSKPEDYGEDGQVFFDASDPTAGNGNVVTANYGDGAVPVNVNSGSFSQANGASRLANSTRSAISSSGSQRSKKGVVQFEDQAGEGAADDSHPPASQPSSSRTQSPTSSTRGGFASRLSNMYK